MLKLRPAGEFETKTKHVPSSTRQTKPELLAPTRIAAQMRSLRHRHRRRLDALPGCLRAPNPFLRQLTCSTADTPISPPQTTPTEVRFFELDQSCFPSQRCRRPKQTSLQAREFCSSETYCELSVVLHSKPACAKRTHQLKTQNYSFMLARISGPTVSPCTRIENTTMP